MRNHTEYPLLFMIYNYEKSFVFYKEIRVFLMMVMVVVTVMVVVVVVTV